MTTCPFCSCDPFHYVDNGLGMEAVAVTCCDLGDAYFRGARPALEEVTMEWSEFVEIGNRLARLARLDEQAEGETGTKLAQSANGDETTR
jgi:hypothetical protein